MAGLLDDVLGKFQGAQQAQVSQIVSEDRLLKEYQGATTELVDSAQQVGNAKADLEESKLQTKRSYEQMQLTVARRFGLDAGEAGWQLGQAADKVTAGTAAMADASARIQEKQRVTIFDSPLKFLLNQFTVNQDIADYNAAERQVGIYSDQGKQLSSLLDEQSKANMATLQTVNQADINNSRVVAAGDANRQATLDRIAGMRFGLDNIRAVAGANKEIAGLANSAYNTVLATQSKEMQREGLDISKAHLALSQQEAAQRNSLKKQAEDDKNFHAQLVTAGYVALTGEVPDGAKIALFSGPASKTEQAKAYLAAGLASFQRDPSLSQLSIASTPWDAANMTALGYVKMGGTASAGMQQTLGKLTTWRSQFGADKDIQAKMIAQQVSEKDKPGWLEREFTGYAQARINADPDLKATKFSTVATNPNFGNTPLWQKVLKPAVDAGIAVESPTTSMPLIISAVLDGKIAESDAQVLSKFYAQGLDLSNASRNWGSVGLRGPTKYQVGNVDYGNAQEFSRYLQGQLKAAQISRAIRDFSPFTN